MEPDVENKDLSKEVAGSGSFEGSFYKRCGKRMVDSSLALLGLVVLSVPMLFIGLGICLVDGFPILFRQRRVGLNGKVFSICKFRTMRNRPEAGTTITVAGDRRVFLLGAFLRRYKLDELPQLLNVFKGEMSFVGPRPDVPGYADKLEGEERIILSIRPGITSEATLAFRNEEELLAGAADPQKYNDEVIYPEKVRLNIQYARTLSFRKDVECIIKTVFGS